VELIGAETTIGSANCSKSLGIGSHRIDIYVNGYYTGTAHGLVEIAEPDGGFITGGGSHVAEDSAGTYAATAGTPEEFAFNVKYTKGFKNLKGHAGVVFESNGKTYEIRSTAIDSLGIVLQASGGGACAGLPSATCLRAGGLPLQGQSDRYHQPTCPDGHRLEPGTADHDDRSRRARIQRLDRHHPPEEQHPALLVGMERSQDDRGHPRHGEPRRPLTTRLRPQVDPAHRLLLLQAVRVGRVRDRGGR
jgi:hypothetical protein